MSQEINSEVLIDEEKIAKRVRELGEEITKDYKGKDLLCVGILKGCVVFFADVIRSIELPITIDFMAAKSYGSGTTSGELKIMKDLATDIKGKDVLLIEDIIDTGKTLSVLKKHLQDRGAASVKICAFLDKPARRQVECEGDYIGYEIPDVFVVGYGLDFDEQYRWLPYVGVLPSDN